MSRTKELLPLTWEEQDQDARIHFEEEEYLYYSFLKRNYYD